MIDYVTGKSPKLSGWILRGILFGAYGILTMKRLLQPSFRERLKEKSFTALIKTRDNSIGRTGRRALQPVLQISHKDLWQFYMLEK